MTDATALEGFVTGLKKIDWNEGLVAEIVETYEQLSAYIEREEINEERRM